MTTYNVVTDLGADDTGSTAIDSAIESNGTYGNTVASGNTLVFPAGDYLLNDLSVGSGVDNFTLKGEAGARLIPKDYGSNATSPWISVQGNTGFEWHGFEILVNGRNPGPVDIEADDFALSRLITRGEVHAETDGQVPGDSSVARTWFSLWVSSAGSTGLIEDCYFAGGSNQSVDGGSNRRAILVDGGQGDLTINRCWFEQWGENTIYAKHPAGKLNIYNCYWRNTQNGARTGGNTEVWNCVSVKDAPQPKNWADGELHRGVAYEATGGYSSDPDRDQYSGLNNIKESDFYHDYIAPDGEPDSCGAAIGGGSAPEYAEIHDVRIYYNSSRSHDAIYNGASTVGDPKRWAIDNVDIDNDSPGDQYCIDVNAVPDNWGPISGELTAENGLFVTGSNYVRDRMTRFGNPDPPDTTPPLPEPVGDGHPMENATIVTIDNTDGNSSSEYSFDGFATDNTADSGTIHPSGIDASEIYMQWAGGSAGRRSMSATGTVDPGETHRYYIADGALKSGSFTQSGNATLTVEGTTVSDTAPTSRWDANASQWVDIPDGTVYGQSGLVAGEMKWYDGTAGEWKTAVGK